MFKQILNKNLFFLSLFALCVFFPFSSANASTISISPTSGTYAVGATFSVNILLNTQNTPVSGVDISDFNYNPAVLEVVSVNPGVLFSVTQTNITNASTGKITFQQTSGGSGTYNGSGTLATINFKAISAGTSNLSFNFTSGATNDTNVAGSGASTGTDTLMSVTGGTITVGPSSGGSSVTLGKTTIGVNVDSFDSNSINATKFTTGSQGGTTQSISVYISTPIGTPPNNQYSLAIYSNSGSVPGTLIAQTTSGVINGNTWNTLPISALLSANTTYWLAYNTNGTASTQNNLKYDGGGTYGQTVWKTQLFGNWPLTFGAPSSAGSSAINSIYVTYIPTVGTPSQDTTPPTISVSAPSTATVGTPTTLSATASDNVAVAGVQFKVNGANVGTEDTTSPYSISYIPNTAGTVIITGVARDTAGLQTTSSGVSVTVLAPVDLTAPTISSVLLSSVTTTMATVTWTTDESSSSFVDYGTTSSYGSTITNASFVTTHSISISGLLPNTTYNYSVRSADSSGNSFSSLNRTFTTLPLSDTQAPNPVTNFSATTLDKSSIKLTWTAQSDLPSGNATSYDIRYSTGTLDETTWASATQATWEPVPSVAGTSETYTIAGLSAGTTYNIGIKSLDSGGRASTLQVLTKATQSVVVTPTFNFNITGPTTLAVVQSQNISGQVSVNTTSGTPAAVSFSATNLPSGITAQFSPTSCTPSNSCSSTMTLSTLASTIPGTYTITINGTNSYVGVRSTTIPLTVSALPPAPVVTLLVNGLSSAVVTSGSTAILSWTASSGNCLASGDWSGSKPLSNISGETTNVITSAKSYILTCTDQYERVGKSSVSVSIQGTAPAQTPVISNVSVTNITATGATISWTTDIPTETQVDYGTTVSYGDTSPLERTLSTSHSVTLAGLSRKTIYHIRTCGTSAQGVQTTSSDTTFKTLARLPKPPKIQNLTASLGSVILNWTNPPGYEFFAGTAILKQTGGYATSYTASSEIARTSATTLTDTNVTAGTTYYYSLFAYDDQGVYADPEYVSATIPNSTGTDGGSGGGGGGGIPAVDITPPSPPSSLLVLGASDGIYLKWNNPTNSDYVRTVVVRKDGSVPTSKNDGTVIYEGTETKYTDNTVTAGKTYYYALFAFDTSINYSTPASGGTSLGALTEAQVQTQLSNLPSEQTNPSCTGGGSGVVLSGGYSRGAKGNEVLLLQRYLNANGFVIAVTGPGSVGNESNYFGALTEVAVKHFQCARGITCSGSGYGVVGPRTRAELAKSDASCSAPVVPVTPNVGGTVKLSISRPLYLNVSGEDVRLLQRFLNANGFVIAVSGPGSPGNETAFFGKKTEDAVKKYQCARGIICSGYGYGAVGPRTRAQLKAE